MEVFALIKLAWHILIHSELVFYCCMTKSPQTQWLKPTHIYHLTVSLHQKSGHGFFAQRLPMLKLRCFLGLWSHLRFGVLFQDHWLLAEISPRFPLTLGWRCSQQREAAVTQVFASCTPSQAVHNTARDPFHSQRFQPPFLKASRIRSGSPWINSLLINSKSID